MRAALALLLSLAAHQAQAAPCVGDNFDRPLPGAQDVERRSSDVPTARYPGLWQEGRVAGFAYQLASDLSGSLADSATSPGWQIAIVCDADAATCRHSGAGAPAEAAAVADALERCLLGMPVSAADFVGETPDGRAGLPPDAGVINPDRSIDSTAGLATAAGIDGTDQEPRDQPAPQVDASDDATGDDRPAAVDQARDPDAGDEAQLAEMAQSDLEDMGPSIQPDRPCGLQLVTAGSSTIQTLQRLLAEAGEQPGPDDGVMGGQTRRAILSALGPDAGDLTTEAAISALNDKLCRE